MHRRSGRSTGGYQSTAWNGGFRHPCRQGQPGGFRQHARVGRDLGRLQAGRLIGGAIASERMAIHERCGKGQDCQVGIRVALGASEDAPIVAQLQIDATLAAYGRIFPASAPPPLFEDVLAEWRDRLGDDTTTGPTTFVAIDDGRLVGVVVAGPDLGRPDRGHIARFYVVPDRWGQGIGHRLYLDVTGWLRRAGYREATLWVLEGNDRARAWYERLGWRATGERKTVYEPAGIVDLQYLVRLAEPLDRPGDDVDRHPSREGLGTAR